MNLRGPKGKIARALGIPLSPKTAKVLAARPERPGQHGAAPQRKVSEYKKQLMEKQRLRAQYNLSERQLENAFAEASRLPGNTGERLLQLLELRLDAVVLRSGFARTIFAARQLVAHGHVTVNGRISKAPGRRLAPGAVIGLRERSKDIVPVVAALEARPVVPTYLDVQGAARKSTVRALPVRDQIPVLCEPALVVEFYSR